MEKLYLIVKFVKIKYNTKFTTNYENKYQPEDISE